MKVIIKNGTLEFQRAVATEVQPTNVIASSYVNTNGSVAQSTDVMWVNVYALTAGNTYLIKGDPDWNSGTTTVMVSCAIGTGTNHLTSRGSISNFSSLFTIPANDPSLPNLTITPSDDIYLYVTNINELPNRTTKKTTTVSVF